MKGVGWVTSGLLAALLLGSACAQAETLVMEADVWCPVNCAQDAERPGIFIEPVSYTHLTLPTILLV